MEGLDVGGEMKRLEIEFNVSDATEDIRAIEEDDHQLITL